MSSKTIPSIIIILIMVFGMISYFKMKDFPYEDKCCKDIRNENNQACKICDEYTLPEKIIYVWKYS
ncbi:MAG: hypothetical protein PHF21_03440 [Bacilli bacterium]|nr:hypothetical protein [Bacilli bacterium]